MTENERDVYLGGYINLGFFGVGSVVSVAIGPLVDSVNRTHLLAVLVTFTELACAATYFAVDFTTLLIARSLTGFGLGGGVPLVYSLLGDLVSERNRGKANAGIVAAFGVGVSRKLCRKLVFPPQAESLPGCRRTASFRSIWRGLEDAFLDYFAPRDIIGFRYGCDCARARSGTSGRFRKGGPGEQSASFA